MYVYMKLKMERKVINPGIKVIFMILLHSRTTRASRQGGYDDDDDDEVPWLRRSLANNHCEHFGECKFH